MLFSKRVKTLLAFVLSISFFLLLGNTSYGVGDYEDHKTVKVGYFENEIFEEGASEGAVRKGYAYEYYLKISEYTGWEYEYVFGSFSDLYQKLLDGEIDVIAGLAKTPEREDIIGYPTAAMGSETYNLVKHPSDDSITLDPATLENKNIGVLDSAMVGALQSFLDDHDINANVLAYPSYEEMLAEYDAGISDVLVAESDGLSDRENAELLYAFGSSDYYLCVAKNRQDLLAQLDIAQNQLMVEEPNYINSLKIKYYPTSIASRSFSEDEKDWLSTHSYLRIGYLNNYLPYSDTDKDGNVTGLVRELIPLMLGEMGVQSLNVSYTGYDNFDAMLDDIELQIIDVAFPVGGGLYYSEENNIYQSSAVVTSNTELVYLGDYHEGKTESFAVNENNRMQYYYVKTNYPEAEISFYNSIDECLMAVIDGKVGCTTLNGMMANDILKNRKYRGLSLKQQNVMDDRCFGVLLGDAGLLKLLNRGLSIVGSEQAQNMAYRYTEDLYQYSIMDGIQDNIWFVVLIVVVIFSIIVLFLMREAHVNKKRAIEREEAGKELEKTNRQLAEAVKEAEEANKAKDYFLSTMSHDIRTPMNSILSMNEMILRECDKENILEYSGHIQSSGKTLLGLINDILDFSKIEAGKLDIIPVEYDISSVLNDLVNIAQSMAEEKGLKLELDIDSKIPSKLKGDEIRIKQAVTNIITNAVKYTKEGTVTLTLCFDRIPDEPDFVLINTSVRDTGVGIKKEEIGKLFDAFERLDKKNNRNVEGTGLGITITQRLLNLMGSKLEVESEYGKGSVFSFSLKQQVLSWEEVGDFEAAFKKAMAEREKYREKFTAPDAQVLVVDDTPVNLTVFKNLLKNTRLNIDTANSADECIEQAMNKKYDIIFLDHMMPYKDGIEALHELKALKNNPNADTPAICLTANAITGMREMYIAAGFDDYLTKPIDPGSLEEAIIKFLPKDKIKPAEDREDSAVEPESGDKLPDFLSKIEGLDVSAGLSHLGDIPSYIDTLKAYEETVESTASEIEKSYEEGNIKNLTTRVHAIKSTSRIIGAMELGDLAEKLEMAGKDENMQVISDGIGTLLADYRRIGTALFPIRKVGVGDLAPSEELSEKELKEVLADIGRAYENADYSRMEELAERLQTSAVPSECSEQVERVVNAISDFDYDEAFSMLNI